VRWQHPDYGWLPPGEFIPLIEKSGNILILTRWVIRQAGMQLAKWDAQGLELSIAINLSANDLLDDELPWFVMDVVRENKLNPKKLVMEVTEEAMVEDFGKANSALERLHDLGLTISIDDFGTGYSSLSQLKNLPVQELKIDRSFVAGLPNDPADIAIVSASVSLAHQLGLKIVAEGVTSSDALHWLRENGVDRAQGFYWSKPIPANEFEEWLRCFSGDEKKQLKPLKIV
jgi:EAL domain-containing protein (putative c-di-GMP-specific phosphodiesterase class I)